LEIARIEDHEGPAHLADWLWTGSGPDLGLWALPGGGGRISRSWVEAGPPRRRLLCHYEPGQPLRALDRVEFLLGEGRFAEVGRYLRQFLSDPRVVEIPRAVWWFILNVLIVPLRSRASAHKYESIWLREANMTGSPLLVYSERQAHALQQLLNAQGHDVVVACAMRYGNPSIASRIEALRAQGCNRILLAPLYPQYCAATTATANDKAFVALAGMRWQPAIRTVPPYHDDPAYIAALATSVRQAMAALPFTPDALLTSFHGMPERTLKLGDPYHCQCQKTARLLGEALGREVTITFQSRFGPAEWIKPYTDETIKTLAEKGVKRIAVTTPGFAADCLETIEEIGVENRDIFLEHGGEKFARLDCLNDDEDGMAVIGAVVRRELQGWI
jgi:ferrochelatase